MTKKSFLRSMLLALFFCLASSACAEELILFPFQGKINSDNINLRSDSTVSSEIICGLSKDEKVVVVSELYEWYKIKLPKAAPSFIKKEMVDVLDNRTAKVSRPKVNIRLGPSESSPILGRVNENEIVNILEEGGGWYKIEPVDNSFGWVNKKFVTVLAKKDIALTQKAKDKSKEGIITVEGTIKPKTITRVATHKLICEDKRIYLLEGNEENLNALNHRKAKISGKLRVAEGYSVIEITKMEALN